MTSGSVNNVGGTVRRRFAVSLLCGALISTVVQLGPWVPAATAAGTTTLIASSDASGLAGSGQSKHPSLSADGRYEAFISSGSLDPGVDSNTYDDVYRKDLLTGAVEVVSSYRNVDTTKVAGDSFSSGDEVAISDDGNKIAFLSSAGDLVTGVGNRDNSELFVHDVTTEANVVVNTANTDGVRYSGISYFSMSADGTKVAFVAVNPAAPTFGYAVYVRNLASGVATYLADAASSQVAISGDGTKVAYLAPSSGTCPYCLQRRNADGSGTETLLNVNTSANLADPAGLVGPDAMSTTGDVVAFWSDGATYNITGASDTNGVRDVFVYDAALTGGDGPVRRVSQDSAGAGAAAASGTSFNLPIGAVSADGRRVAFGSLAAFGVSGVGTGGGAFVKDRLTEGISVSSIATFDDSVRGVQAVTLSADGSVVGFDSNNQFTDSDVNDGGYDVFARGLPLPIDGLTLTVTPGTQKAGVTAIPTSQIDLGLLPLATGSDPGVNAAPLRSSPLRSSPLRSSPLRSSPLRSSPLRSSPLRSSPLRSSPLRSSSLPLMPLSTLPLLLDGGWDAVLVGTPLAGIPLQSVTLQQVFPLIDSGTYPLLNALTLADVDIASSPLRSSPLQSFLFTGPTLAQLSPTTDWCTRVPVAGCNPASSTLLDLSLAGATATQLRFVSDLPVSEADLTGSPIAQYDVGSVNVVAAGLGAIPTDQLPAGLATCAVATCATLADAVASNAISTDAIQSRFGRILSLDALVGGATFEDLIKGVIDPSKVSYAGVNLPALVEQGPFDPARLVTYTATSDVSCAAGFGLTLTVALPTGFRVAPGSSRISVGAGSSAQPIADPVIVPNRSENGPRRLFEFNASNAACDGVGRNPVALSFDASPGVVLGTFTSSAVLTSAIGSASVANTAPVTVTDALEANDTVAAATALDSGSLYVSHVSGPGDVDFYKLPAGLPAGTQVTAVLSHLPADFDLFLDGPSAAPLRSSPLRSSPLRSSPIEDLGLNGDPGGDTLQPDTLQDAPLRSSILSQSGSAARADEQVNTVLTAPTTAASPVTIEVTNHLGTASNSPYLLQVTTTAPPVLSCPVAASPFTGTSGVAGTLPNLSGLTTAQKAAKQTLFLVNNKRLGDAYGKPAADAVLAKLATLAARSEVGGVILPVEGNAAVASAYAAWDANRCDPEKANDVVRAIGTVLDSYAVQLPGLRYVTFVGDDDIVPFARIPDGASVSNQLDYYSQVVFNNLDNPISAAFGRGYLLSDNPLLARNGIAFLGHQLAVPDFAGGRLVETPTEIIGTIDQYVAQPNITLNKTLVTGYDFMSDSAAALSNSLAATQTASGLPVSGSTLADTWNKASLQTALNAAPTVAAVNAHYDHSRTEPAVGADLFSSIDLLSSALPASALLYTMGCQAGLSVPGRAWAAASTDAEKARLLDFAQALAQKRVNGFLGNTGFGYGDTVAIAYSERLLQLFTANLNGSMTLSQAVSKAKQDYLKDGLVGVYDEKVLNESTFYGLPFVTVGPSGVAGPAPTAPAADATGVAPFLGTPARTFSKTLAYAAISTARGSYYTVPGSQPLIEHYRPIQPATTQALPAPPAGTQVGDLWFTGLVSLPDEPAANPVFSMPTTDSGAFSPEPLIKRVNFPVSLGTVTPRGTVALFPGQYRSNDSTPGQGTQLRFSSMDYKVFYPSTADAPRPVFSRVDGTSVGGGTQFRIETTDAQFVGVLYREVGQNTWVSALLTQVSSGLWVGSVGVQVEEYFVQAANDGRVGTTRAKGVNYVPSPAGISVTTAAVDPAGTPPWYRQPVTVAAGTGATASVDGAAYVDLPVTISTDGVHRVVVRYAGTATTLAVPIDQTLPTVTITNPGAALVGPGSVASFTCADATSGIASCTALTALDGTPGTHTFQVKAIDRAGNEVIVSKTYEGGYVFQGFYAPVDNAPILNVTQPGSNVPVKFRVYNGATEVTSTAVVTSVVAVQLASCPAANVAPVETTTASTVPGGLVYNGAQFQYNWKTPKTATGCQKLTITLDNGQTKYALFQFKK